MADVVVIRSQAVPSPNPARATHLDTMIVYQVQPGGAIRSVRIENEKPSPTDVQNAIKASEQHAATIDGQHFTI